MRLRIIGLLIAVWCTPLHARMGTQEQMIWLEPLTYREMREIRAKAMQMAPKSTKNERPGGAGQTERKSAGKDGKKRSWGVNASGVSMSDQALFQQNSAR